MPSQDLKWRLLGEDAGASAAFKKVAKETSGAHDAFSKLSGQLSQMGGPFGIAQEAVDGLAGGFEHIKEHGKSTATVLQGIGIAATGAGLLLAQFGAKDQQAQAQLRQSIENTGASWGDFKGRVEEAIKSGERFGRTADDTQNALNNLTTALQDPNKALAEMGLVEDLAAKKHISLAQASTVLIKAQEGNAKAFRDLGIVLDGNGTKTAQINRALDELSRRLHGQASAAADTFSGRLEAAKATAEDYLSSLAKFAPILTAIGPAAAGVGTALGWLNAKKAEQLAVNEAVEVSSQQELSTSAALSAASADEATATATVTAAKRAEVGATGAIVAAQAAEEKSDVSLVATNEAVAVSERSKGAMLIGAGGTLAKAGGLVLGGYVAGQVASGLVGGGRAGGTLSGVGMGAGAGAALGSVIPGVGTVAGGVVGGVVGGIAGFVESGSDEKKGLVQLAGSGPAGEQIVKDRAAAAQRQLAAALAQLRAMNAARAGGPAGPPDPNYRSALGDVDKLQSKVNTYNKVLKDQAAADKETAKAQSILNEKQAQAVPILDKDITEMHRLTDRIIASGSSADAFQHSLNGLGAAVSTSSHRLTGNTEAAIQNREAVRGLVTQMEAHLDAMKAQGATSTQVRAEAIRMSTQLEKQATKILGNKSAVDQLIGSMHALPKQLSTEIKVDPKDAAKKRLAALEAIVKNLRGGVTIPVQAQMNANLHAIAPGTIGRAYAEGGLVSGGTPGHDSVHALLMPGEFVVDKDAKNLKVYGGSGGGLHVTVYAGMGANGTQIGQQVVTEVNKYYRQIGKRDRL